MGKFQKALLTDAGIALLMQAQMGDDGITFTRGVSGAGVYTGDENIAQMTALKDQKQSFAIDRVRVASDTSVCVRYIITNHTAQGDLQTGYDVTEIGLYAKIGDGDEILYCIAVAEITDYLPPYNELMATSITVEMYCEVGNAEDVTIVAAEGIYALAEDLDDYVPKSSIVQGTGQSIIDIMSQMAVTGALNSVQSAANAAQTTADNAQSAAAAAQTTANTAQSAANAAQTTADTAKAMGTTVGKGSTNNANSLPNDGWYLCDTNIPTMFGATNVFCYVLQVTYSANRKMQIAIPYSRYGNDGRTMAFRIAMEGTWGNWESLLTEYNIGYTLSAALAAANDITKIGMTQNQFIWAYSSGDMGLTAKYFTFHTPSGTAAPIYGGAYTNQSTRKSKKNIEDLTIERAKKLLSLEPIIYEVKGDESGNKHYGLIAEDVDKIDSIPVSRIEDEIIGIDYQSLVAPLIKLVQEQEKRINELEERLSEAGI